MLQVLGLQVEFPGSRTDSHPLLYIALGGGFKKRLTPSYSTSDSDLTHLNVAWA